MNRELKLLKRETDMLQRLDQRLDILLERSLTATPVNFDEALEIVHYQQLILHKLEHCRKQARTGACFDPAGLQTHLSRLDKVLKKFAIHRQ